MQILNGKNSRSKRTKRGSVAVELAAGALVTIGIVALALNVCFAMMSYGLNDRACRDACRAAAQGASAVEAEGLARTIVKSYSSSNSQLAPIEVSNITYTDFGGTPSADVSPFVSVTTRTTAKMPAPIEFFGNKVFADSIPVQKTYTFPIVRLTVNP